MAATSAGPVMLTSGGLSGVSRTSQEAPPSPRISSVPACSTVKPCSASEAAGSSPVRPETVSFTVSAPTSP